MSSKKQKFDDIAIQETFAIDKAKETKAVKEAFEKFLNKPIPKEVEYYEWADNEVLVEIFKYDFTEIMDEMFSTYNIVNTPNLSYIRFFSFAKVLASGPDSKYKPGDIVKLRDADVLSAESSKYIAWVENEYNRSNLKKIGQEPPRFVSNIYKVLGSRSFILNPLDVQSLDTNVDDSIYKLNDAKIENKVKPEFVKKFL